jgi:tetratricopeptide (TPR) repeat protein
VSPSGAPRARLGLALAVFLALSPAAPAFAEETGAPADEGKQGGEPSPRKKGAQEQAEARKYTVRPGTAKVFEKAKEHLEAQRYAEAQAELDELRLNRLSPHERAQAHRLYGYIAFGKEDSDAAIEHLKQALAEEEGLPPRDRADVLFQIAQIQAAEGRWRDVIATLETWFQVVEQPNSVAYYLLALSHYQLEEFDAALAPAQQAVEIAKVPQQAWLQLLLSVHLTRQDYAAATAVLDRMIASYPNVGKDYWMQLAALHGVTGDDRRSLAVLEIAYRKGLLTDDRDVRRMLQQMLVRGVPYRAALIFEKEMAENRFQDDAEALELLSISWILAREKDRAMEPLSRAAELAATGNLYLHLAQIHVLDEEWEQAVAVLRKALAKGGLAEPGLAQLLLGIAYYNERQLTEARSWFARAQQSGATRKQAETWLQYVDREMLEIEAGRPSPGTGG